MNQVLSRLIDQGVRFSVVENNKLKIVPGNIVLSDEEKCCLQQNKQEILGLLQHGSLACMSDQQRRLYFLAKLGYGFQYHVPVLINIDGWLNVDALEKTLRYLIQRHESLRTRFYSLDSVDVQKIDDEFNFALERVDLQQEMEPAAEHTKSLIQDFFERPFTLDKDLLFRALLVGQNQTRHILALCVHHIVTDGWSMRILLNDFIQAYSGYNQNQSISASPLVLQYSSYAAWQKQNENEKRQQAELDYWKNQLTGYQTLELPGDFPRPAQISGDGDYVKYPVADDLTQLIAEKAKAKRMTPFSYFMAAVYILLSKYSGQTDICLGMPVANRNNKDIESIVGFFVNTVVIRIQTEADEKLTLDRLLQRVHTTMIEAQDNQNTAVEQIIDFLNPPRDLSRTPIFQIMVNYTPVMAGKMAMDDCMIEPSMDFDSQSSKFDLTFTYNAYEQNGNAEVFIEYSTDLYRADSIDRIYRYLQTILHALVHYENDLISEIDLLSEQEKQIVLKDWNNTASEFSRDLCLHQLFSQQVKLTPNQTALIYKQQQISYQELDEKSTQLALYLQQLSISFDQIVGVCLTRSPQMIIAVLAVLKSGAAYLPLDSSYPDERLQFMLTDSQAKYLLTESALQQRLSQYSQEATCQMILLDDQRQQQIDANQSLLEDVTPQNLAYVIYTSGSTGQPKGVMIEHHSVVNHNQAVIKAYQLTADDRVMQFSAMSFDIFVEEVFPTLISGATLVLLEDQVFTDLGYLKQVIKDQQISLINLPTAYWNLLVDESLPETQLKRVVIGGEKVEAESYQRWISNNPDIDVINTYGPTETTVISLLHHIDRERSPSQPIALGKPLANTRAYVLDENQQPLPIGIAGELHTAGEGVARGYLHQPALTAEKFIADPFSKQPGQRLYKTGDKVRWLADGNLEYIGRIDQQVKIRGFRVELGEIESLLATYKGVKQAIVVTRLFQGSQQLIAYLQPIAEDKTVTIDSIKQKLSKSLPEYMVPAIIVMLPELPLTTHGKVDRNALANKQVELSLTDSSAAAETELQQTLLHQWQAVLQIDQIGIDDNFFELGGHSLLAVHLINQINDALDKTQSLTVVELFKSPTIRELSRIIASEAQNQFNSAQMISLRSNHPVFIIPGMPGRSDGYLELANALTRDGDVIGLQMQGYNDDQPATSIEQMAAYNLDLIRQVKPKGKIHLYAHSYGGTVVYEMLRQIKDSDWQVGEIVLIDSIPYQPQTNISRESVVLFCKVLLEKAGVNPELYRGKIDRLLAKTPYSQWKQRLSQLIAQSGSGIEARQFAQIWDVTETSLTVPYRPMPERLNHQVKLVIAEQSKKWLKAHSWNRHFQRVDVVYSPGDHLSLVTSPQCKNWIKQLHQQEDSLTLETINRENMNPTQHPVLSVNNLEKYYTDIKAVDKVSFDLQQGTCFGLLGPNGAGKSTTIEMMEGILTPSRGQVLHRGKPIDKHYKSRIGIQFQQSALPESLTVKETLRFFQRLYKQHISIDEVIAWCSLEEYINRDNAKLSGGQRQRLLLAIALINDPDVIFLDEPTTGLDPQSRHNFWRLIKQIKQQGKTILLTTHYMDEAQQLCDEIAIMDHGRIIAQDTPQALLQQNFQGVVMRIPKKNVNGAADQLPFQFTEQDDMFQWVTENVEQTMGQLTQNQVPLDGLQIAEPNLDDLFLKLTGHSLRG